MQVEGDTRSKVRPPFIMAHPLPDDWTDDFSLFFSLVLHLLYTLTTHFLLLDSLKNRKGCMYFFFSSFVLTQSKPESCWIIAILHREKSQRIWATIWMWKLVQWVRRSWARRTRSLSVASSRSRLGMSQYQYLVLRIGIEPWYWMSIGGVGADWYWSIPDQFL